MMIEDWNTVAFLGCLALAFGLIGGRCGKTRNRYGAGFVLGLFLGIIGCVIALFLPPPMARLGKPK